MLEIGAEPGELRNGLTRTGVEIVEGQALIPQLPGLGIELDPETVERFLVL
jgi:L-alanine-DL-glutamate epimerase-like enolase superfamily enzyme